MSLRVKLAAAAGLVAMLGTTPAHALVYGVKSLKVTSAVDSWLQIGEIQAFDHNGKNVARDINGGVATNIGGVWRGFGPEFIDQGLYSGPEVAINGNSNDHWSHGDVFYPADQHGTSITITFDSLYNLSSFSILGRVDADWRLNIYNILLLDAAGAPIHGFLLDARDTSPSQAFATIKFVDDINPPSPGVPGVPEPTSWALMISGFGLAGAAVRRRRTALTTG